MLEHTQGAPQVHFGHRIEAFLAGNIPQLQAHGLIVNGIFEFGGEVAADGGPDFLVEFLMNILAEHGSLTNSGFAHNAELDYDVLLHRHISTNKLILLEFNGKYRLLTRIPSCWARSSS